MYSVSLAVRQSISKWCVCDCFQIYDYFHPCNAGLKKKKTTPKKLVWHNLIFSCETVCRPDDPKQWEGLSQPGCSCCRQPSSLLPSCNQMWQLSHIYTCQLCLGTSVLLPQPGCSPGKWWTRYSRWDGRCLLPRRGPKSDWVRIFSPLNSRFWKFFWRLARG